MNLSDYSCGEGGSGTIACPVLAKVAASAGCSPGTLYMIAKGHKKASAKLAVRIQQATASQVSVHDLRPDVFGPPPANPAGDVADAASRQEAA
ncbi:transcriptional regulator [Xanthomonas arboricola]|uniref:transcriptional regulator n=1 Tax=Xanthomonas arboricola TaxID=56448 RepID=UPI004040ACD4